VQPGEGEVVATVSAPGRVLAGQSPTIVLVLGLLSLVVSGLRRERQVNEGANPCVCTALRPAIELIALFSNHKPLLAATVKEVEDENDWKKPS
jgi:hypothetical protein